MAIFFAHHTSPTYYIIPLPCRAARNSDGRGSVREAEQNVNPLPTDEEMGKGSPVRKELATHLLHTGHLANWLHAANTAVYGQDYKQRRKNIATHFFNEHEANWHIDTSLLKYTAQAATDPVLVEWMTTYKHLGRDPAIALWLFKTEQHAYNLQDSIMIEFPRFEFQLAEYPQLCNMQYATAALKGAVNQLMCTQSYLLPPPQE